MKKEILKNVYCAEGLKRMDCVNNDFSYNLKNLDLDNDLDNSLGLNDAVILHGENVSINLAHAYVFVCEHKNHFETRGYHCKVVSNMYACDKWYLHTIYCLNDDYDYVVVDGKIIYLFDGKLETANEKYLPLIIQKVFHKLFEFNY